MYQSNSRVTLLRCFVCGRIRVQEDIGVTEEPNCPRCGNKRVIKVTVNAYNIMCMFILYPKYLLIYVKENILGTR